MSDLAQLTDAEGIRHRAREKFESLKWPTPTEEEWRRTDLSRFLFDNFIPRDHDPHTTLSASLSGDMRSSGDEPNAGAPIRFTDGKLERRTEPGAYGEGLDVAASDTDIRDLVSALPDEAANATETIIQLSADEIDNRVQAWHQSERLTGVIVYVHTNVTVPRPVQIRFEELNSTQGLLTNPHVFIVMAEGAEAEFVISHETGSATSLCNSGIDVMMGDSSKARIVTIADMGKGLTHFAHNSIRLGRDSKLDLLETFFGGSLQKSRTVVSLASEGAEAYLNGAYLGDDGTHFDIRTVQSHRAPHTTSRALYKGAVAKSARTIYQGLIDVDEKATQTDAYLTNNNLVLEEGARADSIPSLKIRTDQVRCSHGSTTGKIDENEIFYLMSRGIAREDARIALIEGYFEDVVKSGGVDALERIMDIISARLEME